MTACEFLTLPRSKETRIGTGKAILPTDLGVTADEADTDSAITLLRLFMPGVTAEAATNGHLHVTHDKALSPGAYTLRLENGTAHIRHEDYEGLRNAIASLSGILRSEDGRLAGRECELRDAPSSSHRGVMLDLARGVVPLARLREDLILIAKMKMNEVHLHLSDSKGVALRLESLTPGCYLENAYSLSDARELAALCRLLCLEIIPEFDLPAHSLRLVAEYGELACDTERENPSGWVVCAGTDATYRLYSRIIGELCSLFPGRYFHIGADELEFPNNPEKNLLCHWDECNKCRRYMAQNGIPDRQRLYYHFISRIHDIVRQNGRTAIMWSDRLDMTREVFLPEDMILQYWRLSQPRSAPPEARGLAAQIKLGHRMINSNHPDTYLDLEGYMNADAFREWQPDVLSDGDTPRSNSILGSELCAWEYGNPKYSHYLRSLPPAVVMMGDKLWNNDALPYGEQYEQCATRAVLGYRTPPGLNIFKCLGSILPPRNDTPAYLDMVSCGTAFLTDTAEKLAWLSDVSPRAAVYRAAILAVAARLSASK